MYINLIESKSQSAGHAHGHNGPTRLDDNVVGQTTARIPHQVAEAVEGVVGEGEGHGSLEENLSSDGESTHGGNHGGGLEVPAESGRGEVCGGPQVERAGEGDTSDTVQGGADPADLGAVDAQVRRDGAGQALLDQDLGGVLSVGGDGPGYQMDGRLALINFGNCR